MARPLGTSLKSNLSDAFQPLEAFNWKIFYIATPDLQSYCLEFIAVPSQWPFAVYPNAQAILTILSKAGDLLLGKMKEWRAQHPNHTSQEDSVIVQLKRQEVIVRIAPNNGDLPVFVKFQHFSTVFRDISMGVETMASAHAVYKAISAAPFVQARKVMENKPVRELSGRLLAALETTLPQTWLHVDVFDCFVSTLAQSMLKSLVFVTCNH